MILHNVDLERSLRLNQRLCEVARFRRREIGEFVFDFLLWFLLGIAIVDV